MTQRIAVVSGGIGGLGTAICRSLALSGHRVIATDLAAREERIAAFRAEHAGSDVHFEPGDVSDFAQCQALLQRIEATHGPVDVLVNAAGITRDVTLRKMAVEQWQDVLRVNLDGVFNLCRNVVDGMCSRGYGRIVNISSVNGQTGQLGQTNYSAAKAGMHGFTMALAREVARKGVTVNSVSPGYCETAMVMAVPDAVREKILEQVPVGRLGQPSEIARVVDFLCAADSGFITGANIPVNGGLFMSF
ncbi:MAG: acetoacetyl-CoA reductase [Rhodanobacteraceae bacterium]|nr:acetoacetyl-CoA reductase [Xanthomonadales bacterium]MCP5478566.1 acetoacetyl-CoA reductase [Rhodanobacteraceae bacterium]HPF73220.1 acetoacetyl-CoA reductase [Xanthomonadaceae bacterium]HRX99891.1 acetoacetyl-CoA reductase [Xanthomonadaceae bacterium]